MQITQALILLHGKKWNAVTAFSPFLLLQAISKTCGIITSNSESKNV